MDRLPRSLTDLREIVDELVAKGASVQFVGEGQAYTAGTDDSLGRLLLHVIDAFAEFEGSRIGTPI